MKRLIIVFLLIPLLSLAYGQHIKVEEGKDCVDCHGNVYDEWMEGAHGLNNVRCFICHGSLDKYFIKRANINKCNGCHQNEVNDLKKIRDMKDCFFCHRPHSLETKFHKGGGK